MRLWRILAAVFGLAAGVAIIALVLAPRVVGMEPAMGKALAYGPLVVSFNVPLDIASVVGRASIDPHVSGEFKVNGRDIIFTPSETLKFGESYAILIDPGVRATNGLPLLTGWRGELEVAAPRLVFLREEDGVTNLWTAGLGGSPEQLSHEPQGVWDYSSIPGGRDILLSAYSEDGSLDLVRLSPDGERGVLLDCGSDDCREGRWQPHGELVAFERASGEKGSEEVEVWLLDSASGAAWPADDGRLLQPAGIRPAGRFPRWSADGRYLSYYHPEARALLVADMEGGVPTMIPANLELMGDWSPKAYALAYSELAFGEVDQHLHEEDPGAAIPHRQPSLTNHLVVTDVEGERTIDLSAGLEVDDSMPAWRPDGVALAVGRSSTGGGRQMWLLGLDGTELVLTDEPMINHSAPAWSPDGRKLAFMRSNVSAVNEGAAVWLLNLESGKMLLVEEGAFLPGWLPG